MTPVSSIDLGRTRAWCKARHPEETVTYQLPGIHLEPICNAGNLGRAGISLSSAVSVRDSLLDVFVLQQANVSSLLSLTHDVLTQTEPSTAALQHWQGRGITLVAEPNQTIQADGEVLGQTPVTAKVLQGAVRVIVPDEADVLNAPTAPQKLAEE